MAANAVQIVGTTDIADGLEHLVRPEVVGTGDSPVARLWIDGDLEGEISGIGPHLYSEDTSDEVIGTLGLHQGLIEVAEITAWRRAGLAAPDYEGAPEHRGVEGRWGGKGEDPSIFAQWPMLEGTGTTVKSIGTVADADLTLAEASWTEWTTPVPSSHLEDPVEERPAHLVVDLGARYRVGELLLEILDPEADATYGIRYLDVYTALRPEAGAASLAKSAEGAPAVGASGWATVTTGAPKGTWTLQLDAATRDEAMHLQQLFGQRGRRIAVTGAGVDDVFADAHLPHRQAVGVVTGSSTPQRGLDSHYEWTVSITLAEEKL